VRESEGVAGYFRMEEAIPVAISAAVTDYLLRRAADAGQAPQ
jgi:hypothetical protein